MDSICFFLFASVFFTPFPFPFPFPFLFCSFSFICYLSVFPSFHFLLSPFLNLFPPCFFRAEPASKCQEPCMPSELSWDSAGKRRGRAEARCAQSRCLRILLLLWDPGWCWPGKARDCGVSQESARLVSIPISAPIASRMP